MSWRWKLCDRPPISHSSLHHDLSGIKKANFTTMFLPYLTLQFNHEVTTRIYFFTEPLLPMAAQGADFDDNEFHCDGTCVESSGIMTAVQG